MLGYFPTPYRDEVLYSVCARFRRRMGYSSPTFVSRALFTSRIARVSTDLPSHIDALIGNLPPNSGLTAERLIVDHTLFPYYAPFLPAERRQRLYQGMRGDDGRSIRYNTGLVSGRVPTPRHLRLCMTCVEEDRRQGRHGEAYWHRIHQVPGVEVCPAHGLALVITEAEARYAAPKDTFITAEEALQRPIGAVPNVAFQGHLWRLSVLAERLLQRQKSDLDASRLPERYINLLRKRGLATYSGIVHIMELEKGMRERYPEAFLAPFKSVLSLKERQSWPRALVRNSGHVHHPFRHLLLIDYLGCTLDDVFAAKQDEPPPFGQGPWLCLNPVCPHYKAPAIVHCEVQLAKMIKGRPPVGTFACPTCGFTYTRVGPDESSISAPAPKRVQQVGPLWEAELRHLLEEQGLTMHAMAARLGVSKESVRRHASRLGLPLGRSRSSVASAVPTANAQAMGSDQRDAVTLLNHYREAWLQLCRDHAGLGVTAIRAHGAPVFRWLYTYDREWLASHTPKRTVKSVSQTTISASMWKQRDVQIAEDCHAVAALLRAIEPPIRITRTAIDRRISRNGMLSDQHLEKLPMTAAVLAEVVETRLAFAKRRVLWLAARYRREGGGRRRRQFISDLNLHDLRDDVALQAFISEVLNDLGLE